MKDSYSSLKEEAKKAVRQEFFRYFYSYRYRPFARKNGDGFLYRKSLNLYFRDMLLFLDSFDADGEFGVSPNFRFLTNVRNYPLFFIGTYFKDLVPLRPVKVSDGTIDYLPITRSRFLSSVQRMAIKDGIEGFYHYADDFDFKYDHIF